MEKEIKKIDKKGLNNTNPKESLGDLKKWINIQKQNPIMAYVEKFDELFKKKKKILEAWEILFSPGKNNLFYIITSWELNILRYTSTNEKKEIGKAYAWSFIWEWIIFGRNQKDVEAQALTKTEIFALNLEDLQKLEKESPKEAMELYKYIIEITNKRLLDSGKELASIYEATNKIVEMAKDWEKWFFDIMNYLKWILGVDYIIFIEQHQAVDNFFFYKYNTSLSNMWVINKKAWAEIDKNMNWLLRNQVWILGTFPDDSVYAIPLNNNWKLKWLLIAGKRKWIITDNQMRISQNIWLLLGSIVENNQKMASDKARDMSKNYLDNSINFL